MKRRERTEEKKIVRQIKEIKNIKENIKENEQKGLEIERIEIEHEG